MEFRIISKLRNPYKTASFEFNGKDWPTPRYHLLFEFTVVDESPQFGLFDEIELLFEGELFIVKSW